MLIGLISFIVFYIVCSILTYGIDLAHFQGEFPTFSEVTIREHKHGALGMSFMGPFGLIAVIIETDFCKHGLMFRVKDDEETKHEAK